MSDEVQPRSFWQPLTAPERLRTYTYPDGFCYQVFNPVSMHVSFDEQLNEIHHLLDKEGNIHRIGSGWRIMRIDAPKPNRGRIEELR